MSFFFWFLVFPSAGDLTSQPPASLLCVSQDVSLLASASSSVCARALV